MVVQTATANQASPTGRFAAFSFVDRITRIEGTTRVCGLYTIPPTVSHFPVSLVAEAIGQLAAWVAMSVVNFSHRPVAALAGDTRMHRLPRAGDTLELIVDIESCDAESIQYRGRALVDGQLILELSDTLGSMLDIHEFDAPEALRADFEQLISVGRAPGAFKGVPKPVLKDITGPDEQQRLEAHLFVPEQADFFLDHFPQRPVFPATLMLDAQLQLAQRLAHIAAGGPVSVRSITNVKVRAFTAPGATLVLFAERADSGRDDAPILIKVGAQAEGRTIAGAKMFFVPETGDTV